MFPFFFLCPLAVIPMTRCLESQCCSGSACQTFTYGLTFLNLIPGKNCSRCWYVRTYARMQIYQCFLAQLLIEMVPNRWLILSAPNLDIFDSKLEYLHIFMTSHFCDDFYFFLSIMSLLQVVTQIIPIVAMITNH